MFSCFIHKSTNFAELIKAEDPIYWIFQIKALRSTNNYSRIKQRIMPIKLQKNRNTSPFASTEALPIYVVPYWNVLFRHSSGKKYLI